MTDCEVRICAGELRELPPARGGLARIAGYAAVFDTLSADLGGFRERIAPGAFTESVKGGAIVALVQHDPSRLLGRQDAGTLTVTEDARGLWYELELPDTQYARDLRALIARGDVRGSSIGFGILSATWAEVGGRPVRTVTAARLMDVSPVIFPAYPSTSVALRELGDYRRELAEHGRRKAARARRLSIVERD